MRYSVLAIIFIFLFSTESFAGKLKVGETYSGTLTKLYLYDNALPLPPGSWKVYEIKKNKNSQQVDFNGKDGSTIRVYLPTTKQPGVRWVGTDANCSNLKDDVGGKILAEGNDPKTVGITKFGTKGGYTYWCIVKNSSTVFFSAHLLQDKQYTIYYKFPVKITSINSTTAKKYGERFFKEILMAFDGKKSASLSFLSEIIGKKNNTSSSTSSSNTSSSTDKRDFSLYSDKGLCKVATKAYGMWNYGTSRSDQAVAEAKSRNLSLNDCNKLTGRGNSEETKTFGKNRVLPILSARNDHGKSQRRQNPVSIPARQGNKNKQLLLTIHLA